MTTKEVWWTSAKDPLPGGLDRIEFLIVSGSNEAGNAITRLHTRYRYDNYRTCGLAGEDWSVF